MSTIAWNLAELDVPKNGIRVMSTFACGGGSSMGYKRAGCEVVAANDIDPQMAKHYRANLEPRYYYLCPIRELLEADLPGELFDLDILDGSPPCSTFSTAGTREKTWGKNKHFREGQAKQVLSDLFFDYLDLVERLKPRVAIAENVKGMIAGNAKGYVKLVIARFRELGYRPQLFLINAADCGVPQRRERVFFCAVREDLKGGSLRLAPKARWITAGEATQDLQVLTAAEKHDTKPTPEALQYWRITEPGKSFAAAKKRSTGKATGYGRVRNMKNAPSCTLTASVGDFYHWTECRKLTLREWIRLGSFPEDYKFETDKIGKYMIGMSVPPKMAETVARAVIDQWLGGGA